MMPPTKTELQNEVGIGIGIGTPEMEDEFPKTLDLGQTSNAITSDNANQKHPSDERGNGGGKKDPSELRAEQPQKPESITPLTDTPGDSGNAVQSNSAVIPGLEPLTLTSSSMNPLRFSREQEPGAFPVGGTGLTSAPRISMEQQDNNAASTANPDDADTDNLAVASRVEDLELDQAVPQPSDAAADSARKREESNKKIKRNILLTAILLIAIVVIVITVTVPGKDKSATMEPTVAPSEAPTTFQASILSLFPDETIQSIMDVGSPQSRAWQWLLEDIQLLSFYKDNRIIQKFALATLYYATGGDQWANNTHWLDHSINECNWFNQREFSRKSVIVQYYPGYLAGFLDPLPEWHCNEDGLYQHLWLDGNNLVGTLPAEFYLLTSLVSFSAGFSAMQGTMISTEIGKLTELEGFVISDQKDGGRIPSEIGLLSKLVILSLRNCQLDGTVPKEIWQLTNLYHFGLSVNRQLHGTIADEIGNFKNLGWLILDGCDFHGSIPSEMGLVPNLDWITLGNNKLTELGELTSLFLLSPWGNQFTGTIPTELGLLSLLHELEFQGNMFTGRIPSEFGQLSSIGHLTFANNSLSGQLPTELSFLQPTLHTLPLQGNPMLSGTIPDGVCNMNGTCVSSAHDRCNPVRLSGLSFDCSDLLCGCGCSCQGGNTSRT
ncbi:STYKc [Seminavis robusta]|uniref:STYKc n=1 Tax=Seminavis robusta TaxID=568900 RepID=A0A9N8HEE7_9STRA|nr:STYKc [Seminavis robusta]|eukprot:Sro469_g149300.1 STYKc (664) ;mRNA; r:19434-21675